MAVESAADRAAFVDTDEFGVAATYTAAGQAAVSLNGILDEPTEDRLGGAGPGLRSNVAIFTVRTADLPGDARSGERSGDRLVIASRTFRPQGFDRDVTGDMTVIMLEEMPNEG